MRTKTKIENEQLTNVERENELSDLLTISKALLSVEDRDELRHFFSHSLKAFTGCIEAGVISYQCQSKDGGDDARGLLGKRMEILLMGEVLKGVVADETNFRNIQRERKTVVYSLEDLIKPGLSGVSDKTDSRQVICLQMLQGEDVTGMVLLLLQHTGDLNDRLLKTGFLPEVADQLSLVVNRILVKERRQRNEAETKLIIELNKRFTSAKNKVTLQQTIAIELTRCFQFQRLLLIRPEQFAIAKTTYIYCDDRGEDKMSELKEELELTEANLSLFNFLLKPERPIVISLRRLMEDFKVPLCFELNFQNGAKEIIILPYKQSGNGHGCVILFSDVSHKIDDANLGIINAISTQLAVTIAFISESESLQKKIKELSTFKQQLEVENIYLQAEINTTNNFSELIGSGEEMSEVLRLISLVSATQSSVLLMGETGTGKELIARAIHNNSSRRSKVMVKVNCATLPANLIESELFGHEKGSFTGAVDRRLGKFELANNGTIFLDEIGELPLDLQAKLLRALQEQEIERIGGRNVIKTNVRIIAATNRNLEMEVQQGNFRSDLFFRLNIFPIIIPPLRNRKEDIPLLAKHFLEKHSLRTNRKILGFSSKVIKELTAYSWPGNVRELEHLIERTILMTAKSRITEIHLPDNQSEKNNSLLRQGVFKTIDEVEKEHILTVLRYCKGKVGGIGGAAEILKLPATTVHSKMKRLGISRKFITRLK